MAKRVKTPIEIEGVKKIIDHIRIHQAISDLRARIAEEHYWGVNEEALLNELEKVYPELFDKEVKQTLEGKMTMLGFNIKGFGK